MFNSQSIAEKTEKTFIPVILTLVDGESLKGAIAVPHKARLGDLLNSSDKYILFKTNTGEPIYLAQTSIAAVQSNEKPSANQLDRSLRQFEQINPYSILKVEPGVDKATLRTSYHQLVKYYHPDQYANVQLPKEVSAYLECVIQRLNAAYQELLEDIERLEKLQKQQNIAQQAPDGDNIHYFGQ